MRHKMAEGGLMGWVSIKRANDPAIYFGIDGDFIDICDLCNYPYPGARRYAYTEQSEEAGVIHYIWTCPDCACKNMR